MKKGILLLIALLLPAASVAKNPEHTIFNVFRAVDMGDGYTPPQDFYVSLGKRDGARTGSTLEVYRRIATYNLSTREHNGEMVVPIATLKVIHVDNTSSIARIEKMLPTAQTVSDSYLGLRIGDIVRNR